MIIENYRKEIIHTAEYRELLTAPVNYVLSDGTAVSNFNLSPELMTAEGWTEWTSEAIRAWHEAYDPEPLPRQKCTK